MCVACAARWKRLRAVRMAVGPKSGGAVEERSCRARSHQRGGARLWDHACAAQDANRLRKQAQDVNRLRSRGRPKATTRSACSLPNPRARLACYRSSLALAPRSRWLHRPVLQHTHHNALVHSVQGFDQEMEREVDRERWTDREKAGLRAGTSRSIAAPKRKSTSNPGHTTDQAEPATQTEEKQFWEAKGYG